MPSMLVRYHSTKLHLALSQIGVGFSVEGAVVVVIALRVQVKQPDTISSTTYDLCRLIAHAILIVNGEVLSATGSRNAGEVEDAPSGFTCFSSIAKS